jgi:hypothetical protein
MEIDHVFLFIEPGGPQISEVKALGLVETYRRTHQGQGTANVCFAFDNAFLELLWVCREAEARSPLIERTRLWERSQWRSLGTCPLGIAVRGDLARAGIPVWRFRPPYLEGLLPPDLSIQVATDSDDPTQPMLFAFPGSTAPREWPEARRGDLQRAAGWSELGELTLQVPSNWAPGPALQILAAATGLGVETVLGGGFGLTATLTPTTGSAVQSVLSLTAGGHTKMGVQT